MADKESDSDEHRIEGAWGTLAEQKDEAYYDDRSDADDDLEKGRIKFPQNKLYGRDRELDWLRELYNAAGARNEGHSFSAAPAQRGMEDQFVGISSMSLGAESIAGSRLTSDNPDEMAPSQCVFLKGYSGIGKSTLVKELVRQLKKENIGCDSMVLYAYGKFSDNKSTAVPFSAFAQAFQNLTSELMNSAGNSDIEDWEEDPTFGHEPRRILSTFHKHLGSSELVGPGTHGRLILKDTFPVLAPLLCHEHEEGPTPQAGKELSSSMDAIHETCREFLTLMGASVGRPLLLFLDDLQWADKTSLDILSALLTARELRNIFFICSFRSNEVDENHPCHQLMIDVEHSRDGIEVLELFPLPIDTIGHFIADSVNRSVDEVRPLTDVIYQKTLGNVFYVMQAIEQLVRKNALYYDVMYFEWKWNVSEVELGSYLTDDVVIMVKSKIESMKKEIQTLLIIMAHIPNGLDVDTIQALLQSEGLEFDTSKVIKMLKLAVSEGVILGSGRKNHYIFSHDRIREASSTMIQSSSDRDELLVRISKCLLKQTSNQRNVWMLFVAVEHLNSVPPRHFGRYQLAELNLRVARVAYSKGLNAASNKFLKSGMSCLEASGLKWKIYDFTLELCNTLLKSDFSMGYLDDVSKMIQEILDNAKSMDDKSTAYMIRIRRVAEGKTRNYTAGVDEGLKVLKLYGFDLPAMPTKSDQLKEAARLKLMLKGRPFSFLATLPATEDVFIFRVLAHLSRYAAFCDRYALMTMACSMGLRLVIEKGTCNYTPMIVINYATSFFRNDQIQKGCSLGFVAESIAERYRGDKENFAIMQHLLHGGNLSHVRPHYDGCNVLYEAHIDLKLAGSTEFALVCAMNYFFHFISAGLPLQSVVESKLIAAEDYARSAGKTSFLVLFQFLRQFVINLRRRPKNPIDLNGEAFNEAEALGRLDERVRSMTIRDLSNIKLQLAVFFWDEERMHDLVEQLLEYPPHNMLVPRLFLRLSFVAVATFSMGKKIKKESVQLVEKTCLKFIRNHDKAGSVNARSIHLFIKALKSPSQLQFDNAIAACDEARAMHLKALFSERCGIYFQGQNQHDIAERYITNAFWLYRDWGARAKTAHMVKQHEFLKPSVRKGPKW